ncbi:lipase family protein [Streptacidiphilus sp. P02-A3a]|uniref:lipase family protein n=1 Tax=Streptacidiphilus sp. P02-A3a TaxID=2704468 RepID=UPI0015FD6F54|nr:lipase family protein [Streptacidiphilus sp. P02-A3a]QMU71445.1 triacylglycerol lipase [Streptacidiphilus sp. P02-A3a]
MRTLLASAATAALACALAVVPAAVGAATASATARPSTAAPAPGSVVPDQDSFYTAPADIASYQPGQVVGSRPVPDVAVAGVSVPLDAWQISYRTNDSGNQPELAVTTLVVPQTAWAGGGPRPAVSLQSPEDSLGTECAPSYLIATGGDAEEIGLSAELLLSNWAVAFPDFEGPKSVFMAGPQAAHAVLDGIRAVRNFDTDGIGAANPWALDGYSGGAEATGWAAQLQPSYAPDVPLVGAAIGGTPADPTAVAQYMDGGAFSGFEFAAAYGIATEFPQAGIKSLLNSRGQQDFATIGGECELTILGQFPFRELSQDTTVADPLGVPSVAAVLARDTLGATAPATPVYDYHADTDEIVPVGQDNTLVGNWCHAGGTVQEVRDLVGEHSEEAVARETSVQLFLDARFAGVPATSTC